jgi:hypothetical protein
MRATILVSRDGVMIAVCKRCNHEIDVTVIVREMVKVPTPVDKFARSHAV